ncbi:MAG: hypothetical protein WCM76_02395 [Bacteroidota bacterium]|jgi:hypothetical protein
MKVFGKEKKVKAASAPPVEKPKTDKDAEISAAIGLALNLYFKEMHDYEQAILTIQKVIRPYSPWSSKIYGLRQIPFKYPRNLTR